MANVSSNTTSIKFGSSLRIGYRTHGSTVAYTYITPYPTQAQLPYTFTLGTGVWDIESTEICPNCSGGIYSDPEVFTITIP